MNIAVFLPNWVGDAVMATPALRAIRQHFAAARVIGVLKSHIAELLEGTSWLNEHVVLDMHGPRQARWPSASVRLRRHRPDLGILFPNSFHSALVAWLGGSRRRIGYARYGRSLLLTDRLHARRAGGRLLPSPAIDSYNRLAALAGCPETSYRMELATSAKDEAAADAVWRDAHFSDCAEVVCLNPGAAFGAAKHWQNEHFAELARRLVDQRGGGVLVLCGPNERDMARTIAAAAGRPHVHSLANAPVSLGLSKACVRRADLLVTTDSGPRHFAAAFDRPVVTLFGPTHIEWTETYHPKAIHLQKKVPCGPCQQRTCHLDHRCMTTLLPEEVFDAAQELLRRFPPLRVHGQRHVG
jgi:heptosyltransferase-2